MPKCLQWFVFFLITLAGFPQKLLAQECPHPTIKVYVVNGVRSDEDKVEDYVKQLRIAIKDRATLRGVPPDCFEILSSYNQTNGLEDFVEAYAQGVDQNDWSGFWGVVFNVLSIAEFTNNLAIAPVPTLLFDRIKLIDEIKWVAQQTVEEFNTIYTTDINNGHKVILVPHSQGNFFANSSRKSLVTDGSVSSDAFSIGRHATKRDRKIWWSETALASLPKQSARIASASCMLPGLESPQENIRPVAGSRNSRG